MAKQKRVKYFAYGSNLSYKQLSQRCPSTQFVAAGVLHGFELKFCYPSISWPGGSAAGIVRSLGSETWGVIYELSEVDLISLDKFEDVHLGGYRRLEVEIETGETLQEVITYEVVRREENEFCPTADYAQIILDGALEHGLPGHYRQWLEEKVLGLRSQKQGELV